MIGHPIHNEAARVLEMLAGEQGGHFEARQVSAKIASGADVVLTMTRSHRDSVLELAPHKLNTTFTLAEAAKLVVGWDPRTISDLAVLRGQLIPDEQLDIPDPIGGSAETFSAVGGRIAELLPPVLELCRRTLAAPKP